MDAVALHQYGFDCAVASLGTSLTQEHAVLLSRYTEQVVLIYDGDEAGQNATRRAIPMLEAAGIQVKVLRMHERFSGHGPCHGDALRRFCRKSGKTAIPFLPNSPRNRRYGLPFVPDFLPYVAMRLTGRRRLLYTRNKSGR